MTVGIIIDRWRYIAQRPSLWAREVDRKSLGRLQTISHTARRSRPEAITEQGFGCDIVGVQDDSDRELDDKTKAEGRVVKNVAHLGGQTSIPARPARFAA